MKPIYCDANATTPVLPRIAAAMLPWFGERFGNPGSVHAWGLPAKEALARARQQVADLLGCVPAEVVFTSGATEANNLALFSLAALPRRGLVTTAMEHPAVLAPAKVLAARGFPVTLVAPGSDGRVTPDAILAACGPDTGLISVMLANNETGAVQDVAEIGARARALGIFTHTDAAQAVGKIPVDVQSLCVDYLSVAGHKLYAPKGVGALFSRRGVPLLPLFYGGGQEGGRRPGTENIPYCVALGEACAMAGEDLAEEGQRQARLVAQLLAGLRAAGVESHCLAAEGPRLPNTAMLCFPGLRAGDILSGLVGEEVGASAGAACHSGTETASHVLAAMRVPASLALGAIRFSLGRTFGESDMPELLTRLLRVLADLGAVGQE